MTIDYSTQGHDPANSADAAPQLRQVKWLGVIYRSDTTKMECWREGSPEYCRDWLNRHNNRHVHAVLWFTLLEPSNPTDGRIVFRCHDSAYVPETVEPPKPKDIRTVPLYCRPLPKSLPPLPNGPAEELLHEAVHRRDAQAAAVAAARASKRRTKANAKTKAKPPTTVLPPEQPAESPRVPDLQVDVSTGTQPAMSSDTPVQAVAAPEVQRSIDPLPPAAPDVQRSIDPRVDATVPPTPSLPSPVVPAVTQPKPKPETGHTKVTIRIFGIPICVPTFHSKPSNKD